MNYPKAFDDAVSEAVVLCWAMPKGGDMTIEQVARTWKALLWSIEATPGEVRKAATVALRTREFFPSPANMVRLINEDRAKKFQRMCGQVVGEKDGVPVLRIVTPEELEALPEQEALPGGRERYLEAAKRLVEKLEDGTSD